MTDEELLVLAAKAIGWKPLFGSFPGDPRPTFLVGWDTGKSFTSEWYPLGNDGDALRLAVALGIEIYIDTHENGCACTEAYSATYDVNMELRAIVNHDLNPHSATRRAIVCAAAEIGRTMP